MLECFDYAPKSREDITMISIISTTHDHVSDKIEENTDVVKLCLLYRCSLFLALIGWGKATLAGFETFGVGGIGME